MCGIAGFLTSQSDSDDQLRSTALRMSEAIQHRGPDGTGAWTDENQGIAVSHRRLSIVDLSPTGAQPMISADGNLVMVYNGEIYNTAELRDELTAFGITFKGSSDTEVILAGFSKWGIRETITKCIGMFAIAVWNREQQSLTLIRDRLGIKPLYWSHQPKFFIFGSELKALRAHPACPVQLNRNVLAGYLRKGYINNPHTIYSEVNQLPPGCILRSDKNSDKPSIEQYWSLKDIATSGKAKPFTGTDEEATDHLEALLTDAIDRRMVADVPLGAFLSGGIDSSTVAAIMQKCSASPVKTFSIGFKEKQYDESVYASAVAKHLGTDHTDLIITAEDALKVVPSLPTLFDEPFSDPSQIPTYLVSKLTSEHVTVALSGDGGDELFAGYTRYFTVQKFRRLLKQPEFLRKIEAYALQNFNTDELKRLWPTNRNTTTRRPESRYASIAAVLREGSLVSAYRRELSRINNPTDSLLESEELSHTAWEEASTLSYGKDDYSLMQYIDTLDYLPDDILTKVDRASMAASLEARVPLLDHRVVEFSWTLTEDRKIQNNQGKKILRDVLYRHVPKSLVDRPKKGFGVPIGEWIKEPLRDWAEELLSDTSLKETNIFRSTAIRKKWAEHTSGERNWEFHLWDVLIMQAWAIANK